MAKQYEEGYCVVKDAIAKFPEDSELYGIAGDMCKELKKYEEALGTGKSVMNWTLRC